MLKNWKYFLLFISILWILWIEFTQSSQASTPSSKKLTVSFKKGVWQEIPNAQWLSHENNDGDSFFITYPNGKIEVRLYYVDAPEKRSYDLNQSRLKDQADYFGGIKEESIVNIGKTAKKLSETLIHQQSYKIFTKGEKVFDSERLYVLVQLQNKQWLHEKLIESGLARIYTKGVDLPDQTPYQTHRKHLKNLELLAKSKKLGGWNDSLK
jgi:endonuclease YncB( thermonuclease family)